MPVFPWLEHLSRKHKMLFCLISVLGHYNGWSRQQCSSSVMVPDIPSQLRVFSWFVASTDGVDSSIFSSCLLTAPHPFSALLLGSTSVDSILYRTGVRVISVRVCALFLNEGWRGMMRTHLSR